MKTRSIKPEVHNVSQRRQRRTEPQPQATCITNSVKFGRVVFQLCERTDRQTDRRTEKQTYSSQYFAPFPGGEINIAGLDIDGMDDDGQMCVLQVEQ